MGWHALKPGEGRGGRVAFPTTPFEDSGRATLFARQGSDTLSASGIMTRGIQGAPEEAAMKAAFAIALGFAILAPLTARAITINTVPVGNAGNSSDVQPDGLFGRVTSNYRIATTEITNSQYVEFLNAVAADDPNNLYNTHMSFYSRGGILRDGSPGSYTYSVKPDVPDGGPGETNYTYGDKPVVFVSWYDAARFTNWMHNGATAGASTETGAYTMASGVGVGRNPGAIWFLPTENQWYKAAYYDGAASTYYDYPTGSNTAPTNEIPENDTGNSANFFLNGFTQNESYPMTTVGAYAMSDSPYGTFDQGGNVWEWTETYTSASMTRVRRGGSYETTSSTLNANYRETISPTLETESHGFRVATIPLGIPGDYNANNVVDAGDYVLWRKYLGQSFTLPNDSTPGTEPGDYEVWREHFGQTPGSGSSAGLQSNAIPEPCACWLLASFAVIWLCLRK
jgi:formylglycine-generating enzyme required for sulfatase activity